MARLVGHSKQGKALSRAKQGAVCARATYAVGKQTVTRCFTTQKAAERWLDRGVKRGLFSGGHTGTKKGRGLVQ